ncbi:HxHSH motif-containing lipoprotein [Metamycoplasma hominis]|uniref:HxHSH motif-containing lipoprotein n=1 Tax=Metamycoplasma hominis TaxID=2098 RepID=UPI001939E3E4|nr:hypothetical protein [Metamycoplasma hominis]
MKKSIKLLSLLCTSTIISLPAISCTIKVNHDNEDKENLDFSDDFSGKKQKNEFNFKNKISQNIYDLYQNKIAILFNDVKTNYRGYKKIFGSLTRNLNTLRAKINSLRYEQSLKENKKILNDFYNNWLEIKSSMLKNNPFALYLFKYSLIFSDVDAVLADTNLVFETSEFLKYLKTIDDRLEGKDIDLGQTQHALQAVWDFIKAHIFNPNKLTKREMLDKINIEDDKNSHNHSHAIINLTYEMGLWHEMLKKNKLQNYEEFQKEYKIAKKHIIDNINNIDVNNNYLALKKVLDKNWSLENSYYNLLNDSFFSRAKEILKILKENLISIAKIVGLTDKINLD